MLRHGQSEWNAAGVFTGWANAHLTAHGEDEAVLAGTLLAEHGMLPAFVHTSLQRRTIHTADLALAAADRDWIGVRRSWRLNGRHAGRCRAGPRPRYGASSASSSSRPGGARMRSRRRRSVRQTGTHCSATPYATLPPEIRPRAESLADVCARLLPYWYDAIVPDLRAGGCVLVVSHGNTLRALVKHLDSIPGDKVAEVDIPTGIPLVYELGPDLRPDALGGQYLDPHAARAAIATIRNEGQLARPTPGSPVPTTRRIP